KTSSAEATIKMQLRRGEKRRSMRRVFHRGKSTRMTITREEGNPTDTDESRNRRPCTRLDWTYSGRQSSTAMLNSIGPDWGEHQAESSHEKHCDKERAWSQPCGNLNFRNDRRRRGVDFPEPSEHDARPYFQQQNFGSLLASFDVG